MCDSLVVLTHFKLNPLLGASSHVLVQELTRVFSILSGVEAEVDEVGLGVLADASETLEESSFRWSLGEWRGHHFGDELLDLVCSGEVVVAVVFEEVVVGVLHWCNDGGDGDDS